VVSQSVVESVVDVDVEFDVDVDCPTVCMMVAGYEYMVYGIMSTVDLVFPVPYLSRPHTRVVYLVVSSVVTSSIALLVYSYRTGILTCMLSTQTTSIFPGPKL
jgi:hypothetical protein